MSKSEAMADQGQAIEGEGKGGKADEVAEADHVQFSAMHQAIAAPMMAAQMSPRLWV